MTDAAVVRRIEEYLTAKPTDHMLGLKVRLLFEDRAAQVARDAAETGRGSRGWIDLTGGAVIQLPDDAGEDPA